MSEQQAEPISGESGFIGPAAPSSSEVQGEPAAASMHGSIEGLPEGSAASVDAPKLVPEQGAGEMPQADPLKAFWKRLMLASPTLPMMVQRPKLRGSTRRAAPAGS